MPAPRPDFHAVPQNYAALDEAHSAWPSAKVALLPVPYDLTTSYQPGARFGPQALVAASAYLELYDQELDDAPYDVGIHTLPPLELVASGPEAMREAIENAAGQLLDAKKFPIVLGGDHSVTHGVLRALAARCGAFSVLQLDAHADLRHSYQGTPWSHACVGRRACDLDGVTLVQLGVRSLCDEEAQFLKENPDRIRCICAQALHEDRAAGLAALDALWDPVYITIDLDCFDPSVMPATGTPEPGGLLWYDVLALLRPVFQRHRVLGCDVVELAPIPGLAAPDFLAAKLVYKLIGYWKHAQQHV